MAKILYGGGVVAIEGSIGGWTFQENNSGHIVRLRPTGKKARTSKQSIANQQLSQIINEWQNLTLAQKVLWNAFASLHQKTNHWGSKKALTGFNWFFSINNNLRTLGGILLTVPPAYTEGFLGCVYTLSFDNNNINLNYISGLPGVNNGMFVFMTSPLRSATAIYRPQMRLIKSYLAQPVASQRLEVEWSSVFGISYPPAAALGGYSISMLIVPCHSLTGISSGGQVYINEYGTP